MSHEDCLLSDTHGYHNSIQMPYGDILIHAGDLTASGDIGQVSAAAKWLESLSHRHKIAIAGNHDLSFEQQLSLAKATLQSAGVTAIYN